MQAPIEALSRRDLQALAKRHGIRANGSNAAIVQDLKTYFAECAGDMARLTQQADQVNDDAKDQEDLVSGPQSPLTHPHASELSSSLAALKLRSRAFGTASLGTAPDATPTSGPSAAKVPLVLPAMDRSASHRSSSKTTRAAAVADSTAAQDGKLARITTPAAAPPPVPPLTLLVATPPPEEQGPGVLLGMAEYMQQLSHLARPSDPAPGKPAGYTGLLLTGPAGNGKRLMARTLAKDMGARFVVLDLLDAASKAEPDRAGEAVRQACQAAIQGLASSHVLLLVHNLGALSGSQDPSRSRVVACRAKAELMLGLGQIRNAATQQHSKPTARSKFPAPPSNRVMVVGTSNSTEAEDHGVDTALLSCLLGIGPSAPTPHEAVLHVPQANRDCRETILYHMLCEVEAEINAEDMDMLARATEGLSSGMVVRVCDLASKLAAGSPSSTPKPLTVMQCVSALEALGVDVEATLDRSQYPYSHP